MKIRILLISLIMGLLILSDTPAHADSYMGGVEGAEKPTSIRAADGNYYNCLEWDDDEGCRTGNTVFDPELGSASEMWVAPSGRIYWRAVADGGKYRWIPPPEDEEIPGPLVQPIPNEAPNENNYTYIYVCPDGTHYYL